MVNGYLSDIIFKRLYFQGPQSCAELSEWLHKSNPSVTKELNILIEKGLVITDGYAPSTGGRRATRYSIQPECGYVVAVAMDQLFTVIEIEDLTHQQVSEPEYIELDLHQEKNPLVKLAAYINRHLDQSPISKDKIIGVGIAMPGIINIEEGINYTFFNQHLPVSHKLFLEDKLNIPVYIDNDSSLTALAEWTFGQAKGEKNAMVINVGWGTGLGMILDGDMFRGETGYAGEFSHIPISENGVLCECGKRGCLETETSLFLMAEKAVKEIQEGKDTGIQLRDVKYMSDEIIEAAHRGNQYSIRLLSDIGYMLGKGIAVLVHIMNPRLIVLGGRGASAGKILLAPIQQALTQYCIPRLTDKTEIVVSDLGRDASLIGAAALVVENANRTGIINSTAKPLPLK